MSASCCHFEVKDPAVGLLTVTHVKLTGDMGLAHVYYTLVGDEVERPRRPGRSIARRRLSGAASPKT